MIIIKVLLTLIIVAVAAIGVLAIVDGVTDFKYAWLHSFLGCIAEQCLYGLIILMGVMMVIGCGVLAYGIWTGTI